MSLRHRGVPWGAAALVGGVWLALSLARDAPRPAGAAGVASSAAPLPVALDDFVLIPGGSFAMGTDPRRDPVGYDIEVWSATEPQGLVDVPAFYLGRTEVPVSWYRAFVEATGHPVPEAAALLAPPDHPVAWISWPDALAFGAWLEEGLRTAEDRGDPLTSLLSDGWQVALPSEAQWEKAARGTDGRTYPWGDPFRPERVQAGGRGPGPVGAIPCPECAHGLLDMSGNVWEWTASPYQPYPFDPADDGETVEDDALWVMRGGSFADGPRNLRTTVRGGADPGARRPFIGFRLALVPPR